jgi:hypothetical protein
MLSQLMRHTTKDLCSELSGGSARAVGSVQYRFTSCDP